MTSIDDIIKNIRILAKSNYYQSIYNLDNKNLGLRLFNNSLNYTYLQILFLNYLGFYASLNMDIYLDDVDERVLENEVYEDAYVYWKKKVKNKDKTKINKNIDKPVTSQWIFRKKNKNVSGR